MCSSLVACCSLILVWGLLFVVCCLVFGVGVVWCLVLVFVFECWLFVDCCWLLACCLLFVVCRLLLVVCCVLFVGCCLLVGVRLHRSLFGVGCLLGVDCCVFVVCG